MARSPGVPASAAWLRRAGRLFVDNQRLLVLSCAIRLVEAALVLPLSVLARPTLRLFDYARDLADLPHRTLELHRAGAAVSTLAVAAFVLLAIALADAVLRAVLIASFGKGRLDLRPTVAAVAWLAALYGVVSAVDIGLAALWDSGAAALALPAALVVSIPTFYADYAIVRDGRTALQGVVASVATSRRAPRATLFTFVALFALFQVEGAIFVQPLFDSTAIFPGFLVGLLLADGVLRFAGDCALLAIYEPAGARAPAP